MPFPRGATHEGGKARFIRSKLLRRTERHGNYGYDCYPARRR